MISRLPGTADTGQARRFCLCYPHCYPLGHLPTRASV